jgi:putative membrane protein
MLNKVTLLAAAGLAGLAITGVALAAPAQDFLKKAIQGDNSEMRLGALAAQKGASAGLRDFGRTLQTDHAKAKQDAVAVARTVGMAPPSDMTPEASAEYGKLKGLSGAAFDHEFASYMVKDHKKDIADFESQAKSGDARTATLAKQTLPSLRKHLTMAERLSAAG